MAIKDEEIQKALEHNYGLIVKNLLVKYSMQTDFWKDMSIKRTHWESVCAGKVYFGATDRFYELTKIDKRILNGFERLEILNTGRDKGVQYSTKVYLDELEKFCDEYDKNPEQIEVDMNKGTYDPNFIKLFKYVLKLTGKIEDRTEQKFKEIISLMRKLDGQDYQEVDLNILEMYQHMLQNHLSMSESIKVVRGFKNV